MDRNKRFFWLVLSCSIAGTTVGGTSNWVESHQCLQSSQPTVQCLSESPGLAVVKGMAIGMLAGAGAAVGAVWQVSESR